MKTLGTYKTKSEFTKIFEENQQIISKSPFKEGVKEITGKCSACGDPKAKFRILSDNYRESIICNNCNCNTRNRAVAARIDKEESKLLFLEAITPLASLMFNKKRESIFCEYLGDNYKSGEIIQGIRHEDILDSSLEDQSVNTIISTDVFEHVPDFETAMLECLRILKPNGKVIFTIPFRGEEKTSKRAEIKNGKINYIKEAEYHGNPVSGGSDSLVFTDFGWNIFETGKRCGFKNCYGEVYGGVDFAIVGVLVSIYIFEK